MLFRAMVYFWVQLACCSPHLHAVHSECTCGIHIDIGVNNNVCTAQGKVGGDGAAMHRLMNGRLCARLHHCGGHREAQVS